MQMMGRTILYLFSCYSEIKNKLSSIQDDSSYPFIVFPNNFSFVSDESINSTSLFEYCTQIMIDEPCMQQLKEPVKPAYPRLQEIQTSHIEYVRESLWQSTNGHIFKIWLLVSILLGGLPGYGIFEGPIYEKLLGSFVFMLLWVPVLFILLVRYGEKRGYVSTYVPYSKEEIEDLTIKERRRYDKAIEDYSIAVLQYEQELELYNKLMKRRERIMRENIMPYLSWKLMTSFTKSEDYSVTEEPPRRGKCEDRLFSNLMQVMPFSVHVDTVISGYFPDIMIATDSNVFMDIEIDEPYELGSRKEIHYIGCEDEKRNARIANQDWIIIRFSEKQILTDCVSCTKLIDDIKKLVEEGNLEALNEAVSIKETIKDRRWRKEDARLMAINNYRNSY